MNDGGYSMKWFCSMGAMLLLITGCGHATRSTSDL